MTRRKPGSTDVMLITPWNHKFYFCCPLYHPLHHYNFKSKYIIHEEYCGNCAIERDGLLYRNGIICRRERICQKPVKPELLESLIGWLYNEEKPVGKQRKRKVETIDASARGSIDKGQNHVRKIRWKTDQPSAQESNREAGAESKDPDRSDTREGLLRMPETPMRETDRILLGTIGEKQMQKLQHAGKTPGGDGSGMEVLPAMRSGDNEES